MESFYAKLRGFSFDNDDDDNDNDNHEKENDDEHIKDNLAEPSTSGVSMTKREKETNSSIAATSIRMTTTTITTTTIIKYPIFVDLQGFNLRIGFVPKETAILTNGHQLTHKIFLPPFDETSLTSTEKLQQRWLLKHHHGLHWTDGDVAYQRACTIIHEAICGSIVAPNDTTTTTTKQQRSKQEIEQKQTIIYIYVQGEEKLLWLNDILEKTRTTQGTCNCTRTIVVNFNCHFNIGCLRRQCHDAPSIRCGHHSKPKVCAMENVFVMRNLWHEETGVATALKRV